MLGSVLGDVFWLAVTLGVLVTFHEFGHFWVARRCGVRVECFSIGFGKTLWSRQAKDGTVYQVAAIPLGGYVKLADSRSSPVPEENRDADFWAGDFSSKSIPKRMAVMAAGPVFNVIFTVVAFWVMFMVGAHVIAPTVSPTANSLAVEAGIHAGDRVLAVQGSPVTSYDGLVEALAVPLVARAPTRLQLEAPSGARRQVILALGKLPSGQALGDSFKQVGLAPMPAAPIAGEVVPGQPAALAGMRVGDVITKINGEPIADFVQLHQVLQQAAGKNPKVALTVRRGIKSLVLMVVATPKSQPDHVPEWMIGIVSPGPQTILQRYGPLAALPHAWEASWQATQQSVTMIGQMLSGHGVKNMSSVIGIAQVANTSASMGIAPFLKFLALISLSLALVNLLPIPVLDGGQLVFLLVEAIKGSPVSYRTLAMAQMVGLFLLGALMLLAVSNDIQRLLA